MDFAPFPESALRGRRSELRSSPMPLMAEPRYLPPRRLARGAVLRASPVSSTSFVSAFLPPCPSLARVTTRRTCSAVLAIFSGGGRSTCLPPPAACGRASWVEKWQPAAQIAGAASVCTHSSPGRSKDLPRAASPSLRIATNPNPASNRSSRWSTPWTAPRPRRWPQSRSTPSEVNISSFR